MAGAPTRNGRSDASPLRLEGGRRTGATESRTGPGPDASARLGGGEKPARKRTIHQV